MCLAAELGFDGSGTACDGVRTVDLLNLACLADGKLFHAAVSDGPLLLLLLNCIQVFILLAIWDKRGFAARGVCARVLSNDILVLPAFPPCLHVTYFPLLHRGLAEHPWLCTWHCQV